MLFPSAIFLQCRFSCLVGVCCFFFSDCIMWDAMEIAWRGDNVTVAEIRFTCR